MRVNLICFSAPRCIILCISAHILLEIVKKISFVDNI